MIYTREKQVAIEAVTEAAKLCAAVRADMVGADALEKGDKSPVTIADFGSQALICGRLIAAFPKDSIVGEEDATQLKRPENRHTLIKVSRYVQRFDDKVSPEKVCEWIDSGSGAVGNRFWTVDPIDGTKGFLRNEQYAIALALVENGQAQIAALACPALPLDLDYPDSPSGVLFISVRGAGAAMAPLGSDSFVSVHVAGDADEVTFRFVESVEPAHANHALHQSVARAAGMKQCSLRMDSQAKYAAVARGDAVLYLRLPSAKSPDYRENIWDHAAGALIVEEAGGRVTDMYGRSLDFASDVKMRANRGVVVSNGAIHSAVLEALAESMV